MTEFDELLSKALEAARYYYPRLNGKVYIFPKPANGMVSEEPTASLAREEYCRVALNWLDRLAPNGNFDGGRITIGQLRSRILRTDRIQIPREIILAMAVYKCFEISVGEYDVWLGGPSWDGPIPI